jgi:hypothetical protein
VSKDNFGPQNPFRILDIVGFNLLAIFGPRAFPSLSLPQNDQTLTSTPMSTSNETQDKMSDKNELRVGESDEAYAQEVKNLSQISPGSNIGSESLTLVSHLTILPTQSPPSLPKPIPRNGLTRKLRLDVRYLIYEYLGHSEQTIIITAGRKYYGNLTGLVYSCRDLHHEIKNWTKLQPQTALIMHPTFGLYNPSVTSFRVCWTTIRNQFFFLNGNWIGTPILPPLQLQRIYRVEEVKNNLYCIAKLELWQRAMNLLESCDDAKINNMIQDDWRLIDCVFRRAAARLGGPGGEIWKFPSEYAPQRHFLISLILRQDHPYLGRTTMGWGSFR